MSLINYLTQLIVISKVDILTLKIILCLKQLL